MKYLNVAEKNDAARTIAGQLSHGTAKRREGYSVYNKIYEFDATVQGIKSKMVMTSVSGHLLKLEFRNSYRIWQHVDPMSLFEAPIFKSCSEEFVDIKRTLEREIRSCQGLIIWTDCDREGENIGFEIIGVCCAVKPNISIYRAIFSEITPASVKKALQNLKIPDKLQSDAVDVRTELDLRIGAAITRFQTMRLQKLFPENIGEKLISYGSCQIPTLGFVVERYKEIEAFVSQPFWKIKVTHCIDDLTVEFRWSRDRLFDRQTCEDYYLFVVSNPLATVESVITKLKTKWRPMPMDTVELQKLGCKKLKLPAKEVMTIAEKLYTKGIISYPRTDTNMFSKDIDLRAFVEEQSRHSIWGSFATSVLNWGINPRNGNKTDQSHPPIHPTKMIDDLSGKERQVYELICRHFLACISKDAIGSETIVNIAIESEQFSANGLVIHERNYLDVYIYDQWKSTEIHKYESGQTFQPTDITMPEGRTTAPALLTEADLIALMEKHGIGTDATYAEHINTIKEREYIGVVDKGYLLPGVIGMGLYEGYQAMKLAVVKPVLRAEFETDLKLICLGEKQPEQVLIAYIKKYKEAYKQIVSNVTIMDEKMSFRINESPTIKNGIKEILSLSIPQQNPNAYWQELLKCPKCSLTPLVLKPRKNQNHFYIGCLNYPSCKNAIWLPDECSKPQVLDECCIKCGSANKLLKIKLTNSYHRFIFKTTSGWYKTCLVCDATFRNIFNINAACVKKSESFSDFATNTNNEQISNSNMFTGKQSVDDRRRNYHNTCMEKDTAISENIKSREILFSDNVMGIQKQNSCNASSIKPSKFLKSAETKLNGIFNSDDSFNYVIYNTTTVKTTTTAHEGHPFLNRTNSTLFVNDKGVKERFNDCEWNVIHSREHQVPIPIQGESKSGKSTVILSEKSSTSSSSTISFPTSTLTLTTTETELQIAPSSSRLFCKWKGERIKNNASAIYKKQKAQNRSYTWGTQGRGNQETELYPDNYKCLNAPSLGIQLTSQEIKCNKCYEPAKLLTVRKHGPTKGRQFYVCSQKIACKYFQWADENSMEQNNSCNTVKRTKRNIH